VNDSWRRKPSQDEVAPTAVAAQHETSAACGRVVATESPYNPTSEGTKLRFSRVLAQGRACSSFSFSFDAGHERRGGINRPRVELRRRQPDTMINAQRPPDPRISLRRASLARLATDAKTFLHVAIANKRVVSPLLNIVGE